jgi:hypothetical protein
MNTYEDQGEVLDKSMFNKYAPNEDFGQSKDGRKSHLYTDRRSNKPQVDSLK